MQDLFSNMSELLTKVWGKLDNVQKAKIVLTSIVVLALFVIIIMFFSKPEMAQLPIKVMTSEKAGRIESILASNNIEYDVNNSVISVKRGDLNRSMMLISDSGIGSSFTYESAFEKSSIGLTNMERKEMFRKAKETEIENMLKEIEGIYDVAAEISIPDDTDFFVDVNDKAKASIKLTFGGTSFSKNQVNSIVNLVASSVEKLDKNNITITDNKANLLYSGSSSENDLAVTEQNDKQKLEEHKIEENIKKLLGSRFSEVNVSVNLDMNFDEIVQNITEYSTPDEDSKNGIISRESTSESVDETGMPSDETGITANDGTDNSYISNNRSKSTDESRDVEYLVNKTESTVKKTPWSIDKANSSISVTAYQYQNYYEEEMKENGELENKTWNQFKTEKQNEAEKLDIDEAVVAQIKTGTGIEDVVVLAYQKPVFFDSFDEEAPVENNIFMVMMVILILLFVYALIKTSEPEEIVAIDSSISLKNAMPGEEDEEDVGNIEMKNSPTKRKVEKFVDEKPEAVAQLLKNWLSDDWE